MLAIRDLSGRVRFYLDADASETARDVNGKPVASRSGGESVARSLSATAASWMSDRPVLMDLGPGDVAQQATEASFGLAPSDFVADIASPLKYIKHDRGTWYIENPSDALNASLSVAYEDAQPAELNPGFAKTPFVTVGYGLTALIPRFVDSNADFDIKARTLRLLVQALRLQRELRVAALLTTSANWAAANRVAAVAKWNGGVNPAPLTDLFSALAASAYPANTLILPEKAAQYFHYVSGTGAQVRDFVQGGGHLPNICYARARSTVSGANAYIWSPTLPANVALLRCEDPNVGVPSSATFRWLAEGKDSERSEGILVREFFSNSDDGTWLVCTHNDLEVQLSNQIGALITGALA